MIGAFVFGIFVGFALGVMFVSLLVINDLDIVEDEEDNNDNNNE